VYSIHRQKWFRYVVISAVLALHQVDVNASTATTLFISKPIQNINSIAYRMRYIPNYLEGAANAEAFTYKTVAYTAARSGALGRSFLFGPWGGAALLALTAAGYWFDSQNQTLGLLASTQQYTSGYTCYQDDPTSSQVRGYAPSKAGCTNTVQASHPGLYQCPVTTGRCYEFGSMTVNTSTNAINAPRKDCSNNNCVDNGYINAIGHVSGTSTAHNYTYPYYLNTNPLNDDNVAPLFNPAGAAGTKPLQGYAPDIYEDGATGDPLPTTEEEAARNAWKQAMDAATDGNAQTVGDPTQLQDTTTTDEQTGGSTESSAEQVTDCDLLPTLCAFITWFKGDPTYDPPQDVPTSTVDIGNLQTWNSGFGDGSCPATRTTSFMGQTISFPYTTACDTAAWIKPVVIASAYLAAGFILLGVRSS